MVMPRCRIPILIVAGFLPRLPRYSGASRDSIFPRPPPPDLSKDVLGRMIAWRIQEQAFGGLDRESLTFLEVWRTTAA